MSDDILWKPSPYLKEHSNINRYREWLKSERALVFDSYHDLWQWSVNDIGTFWESIWQFFEVNHSQSYDEVVTGKEMYDMQWFRGARLNYAQHLFRYKNPESPALIYLSEANGPATLGWQDLEERVVAFKNYLRSRGVVQGDRVAAYLPNTPVAIIAFLATNALGAIWSCCSPDFGTKTVIERFNQIEPKVFIAVQGYEYNGKYYDRHTQAEHIANALPTLEQCVKVKTPDVDEWSNDWPSFTDVLKDFRTNTRLSFEQVPFEHPIWVVYSSGTTGKPKAITHSHGGVLLEHLKYLSLHNDVKPGEHFFWFTTTGWMMWNFLQASMLVGGIPVLYDGSPGYPNLGSLWQRASSIPIHHFGTSAPYLIECMKKGLEPGKQFNFSLRTIGSTGAPLPAETFDWVYRSISREVWLCSMSGGTDVCTAFVGGNPLLPVRRGRIQSRALGCALYAYNDQGKQVGEGLGEMVIERAMPSMPVKFWNDPGKEMLKSSYFEDFPGKWRHGDWIEIFSDGSLIIHGRSDATLNRKGVRIGTAEIYSVLDKMVEIKDALIINLETEKGDDIMPLFLVLADEVKLTNNLRAEINQMIRQNCSPRHVPDLIIEVPDIPYTLSGKKMEVPIKRILMGRKAGKALQRDALRNPEALDYFMDMVQEFRAKYLV